MKLYIKEKLFSARPHFDVMDENGNIKYTVDQKVATVLIGLNLNIFNSNGEQVGRIEQKKLSL